MEKTIHLDMLEAATAKLIRHCREQGITTITLEEDFYWDIQSPERYDMNTALEQLPIGSLYHDLERVESLAEDESVIGYGLVWLGSLFRYVGERTI